MVSVFSEIDLSDLVTSLGEVNNITLPHELSEIMSNYNSDKGFGLSNAFVMHNILPPNMVCHNYTFFYENMFAKYTNEPITIFEMGVGVPACMGSWAGSLLGWKEYFHNSKIFSADFDKDYLYCDEKITSYYVDQEDKSSIENLWSNIKILFDIIIDDGPHTYSSNLLFYTNSIVFCKQLGLIWNSTRSSGVRSGEPSPPCPLRCVLDSFWPKGWMTTMKTISLKPNVPESPNPWVFIEV
jgi:hypothetical protein